MRDAGALANALDRPRNRHAYGEIDIVRLAAHYAFGLVRNHAFVDGNKRVSAVVTELFLIRNGVVLVAEDTDLAEAWIALAAGALDDEAFADWLGRNTRSGGAVGGEIA